MKLERAGRKRKRRDADCVEERERHGSIYGRNVEREKVRKEDGKRMLDGS